MSFPIVTFSRSPFVDLPLSPELSHPLVIVIEMTLESDALSLSARGLLILDAAFLRAWLEPKRHTEVEPRFGDGHIQTEYIQGKCQIELDIDTSFVPSWLRHDMVEFHSVVSMCPTFSLSVSDSCDRPIRLRPIAPFLSICRRPSIRPSVLKFRDIRWADCLPIPRSVRGRVRRAVILHYRLSPDTLMMRWTFLAHNQTPLIH